MIQVMPRSLTARLTIVLTGSALALVAAVAFVSVFASAQDPVVPAQRLGIEDGRFTVDGEPRFLIFISYFGVMGAADVAADLDFLEASGFDGVRIWPNSPEGPQLMRGDASLDPDELSRLLKILDLARERQMIVDVTFTAEHVPELRADTYREAIARATEAMRDYRNLLIDIENERNLYGPGRRPLASADVADTRAAIKSIDPDRIVTASNSQDLSAFDAGRFTRGVGLDVTAYHDPRVPSWYLPDQIRAIVETLAIFGRPVYLQEPTRFPNPSTDRASYFLDAMDNAKRASAAAWCFHTDLGFNLRGRTFRERLESRLEPEWTFVTTLRQARAQDKKPR